jgi:hypothetical protein
MISSSSNWSEDQADLLRRAARCAPLWGLTLTRAGGGSSLRGNGKLRDVVATDTHSVSDWIGL